MVGVVFDHLIVGRLVEVFVGLRIDDVAVGPTHVALVVVRVEVVRGDTIAGRTVGVGVDVGDDLQPVCPGVVDQLIRGLGEVQRLGGRSRDRRASYNRRTRWQG